MVFFLVGGVGEVRFNFICIVVDWRVYEFVDEFLKIIFEFWWEVKICLKESLELLVVLGFYS